MISNLSNIYGVGLDLVKCSRMEHWIKDDGMIERFFNEKEIVKGNTTNSKTQMKRLTQYYAARFAVKEAFGKALGCGIAGFELKDVYVGKNEEGKPKVYLEKSAKEAVLKRVGESFSIHLSITHEAEYAAALVIISKG